MSIHTHDTERDADFDGLALAPTIKIRPHKGTLQEAMRFVREIAPTMPALVAYLNIGGGGITPEMVEVKHYVYDFRNKWNTFIVTVNGQAVAFTDGPLTP